MKRYRNRNSITNQKPNSAVKKNMPLPSPPANNQTGETLVGGIMNSVIQGVALGTGSQIASRGIDAIMGPRKIEVTESASNNKCIKENAAYIECIKNGDTSQCKDFFDLLNKCNNI
jgi:coiled-coil-helix-coiled-coil-helix domain-containing protein 10